MALGHDEGLRLLLRVLDGHHWEVFLLVQVLGADHALELRIFGILGSLHLSFDVLVGFGDGEAG
jgi:hypothetical protein